MIDDLLSFSIQNFRTLDIRARLFLENDFKRFVTVALHHSLIEFL